MTPEISYVIDTFFAIFAFVLIIFMVPGFAMYDLAGSTVIHSAGGWALLAAILIIGARKGRYTKAGGIRVISASNIPLVTLGAFLLWIGWFGFNDGRA